MAETMEAGSDLYRRVLAFDYGDDERADLMREVWSQTPWMVDAYSGPTADGRDFDMRAWCRARFGAEALPLHGRPGQWQRGGATIHGWTWFGFATEAQMREFVEAWPDPRPADTED